MGSFTLRNRVHNLTTITTALSTWSSSVPTPRKKNHVNKNRAWVSSRVEIQRSPLVGSARFGVSILCSDQSSLRKSIGLCISCPDKSNLRKRIGTSISCPEKINIRKRIGISISCLDKSNLRTRIGISIFCPDQSSLRKKIGKSILCSDQSSRRKGIGRSILCSDQSSHRMRIVNLKSSKNDGFYLSRNGSCTRSIPGIQEGRGREKLSVVTKEGPLDLSLEPGLGQVSGDVEQEDEEAGSGESFPRGTYQSPRAMPAEPPAAPAAPTVTITEVEIGVMGELEDALGFPLGMVPQSPAPKPLVIVISGPSGVGKDAVIKGLQHVRRDIHFVVTATTRAMRPGEVDGVDYFFMSKTEFQEMIENHELLEHAIVYGDYKGIPKQQVREFMSQGMDVILRVDVQGAATVRSILGSEAVFIFLVAESEVALVKRLIERKTETMDKMLVRVATAREELTRMEEFDYVVVNQEGCLDRTISLICSIVDAEKARVKPKAAEI